ncbi:WYL domain-containing protein [Paenibacillus sp. TRM 82003]|uniref:helix-turn-helix transcriptional regulator n=1 Tax=Kineococcus sp. TRM81007 TaxID=2925831 RepID=UPI001F582002|nr:WYL domain-containing protein [Kineococcus sp. TRM81007]MCI2236982.1 WYL domain-containing protein [Kineococcus sp. TRM81007]MCI3926623.1 WYL domain-containing protein [Paenibacillus sp. TRM 82003]
MRSERLVALLFQLQRRRAVTVPELARDLGVSVRTAHRDVAALREAGVPIWSEPGRGGGVRLVDGWRSHLDGLTSREAVALLTLTAPPALAALGLDGAVAAAHAKVSATLPEELRERAGALAQRFHLDAPGWFRAQDDTPELTVLARAVWEQSPVRLAYGPVGTGSERTLEPLGLVLKAGVWYLVASSQGRVRTYRVARVRGAELLPGRFERPRGFDLAAWWAASSAQFERSLGGVVVTARLSARGWRALPSVLGEQVAAEALAGAGEPDAAGWWTARFTLEEPAVAAGQLLALGADVVVLGPARVREELAGLARRVLEAHS